jgi:tRNA nucleotidyltransferase (CCA-adding enzyme)
MSPVRTELTTTEKLNFSDIPEWVLNVARVLNLKGFQTYLVGGAVRDLLWGKHPGDWDLASDALPEEIEAIFPKTIASGSKYGTMTIVNGGNQIEITTLREDLHYSDGRHPEIVHFGKDICLDLARRDFTINAIAFDLTKRELIDPFGGRRDIGRRLLKAVGDPARRYHEDGLRMFRFYRFLATLNLRAHRQTERAINAESAIGVSNERIREEFSKLLIAPGVGRALSGLKKSGLLGTFLAELLNEEQHLHKGLQNKSLWQHSMEAAVAINPQLHLRLAALLHDVAKPLTRSIDPDGIHFYNHDQIGSELSRVIMKRLGYPRQLVDKVSTLIRWHMFFINEQTSDAAIRRLIVKVGPQNIPDLLELRRADIVASGRIDYQTWENWQALSRRISDILNAQSELNPFCPVINGNDLIKHFQLQPGPIIGEILRYLQEILLDDPTLNQRPALLKLAEDYLQARTET